MGRVTHSRAVGRIETLLREANGPLTTQEIHQMMGQRWPKGGQAMRTIVNLLWHRKQFVKTDDQERVQSVVGADYAVCSWELSEDDSTR